MQRWEELTLEEKKYYKKKFRKYEFIDSILDAPSFSVEAKRYLRQNFFMRYVNDPDFREEKKKVVITFSGREFYKIFDTMDDMMKEHIPKLFYIEINNIKTGYIRSHRKT